MILPLGAPGRVGGKATHLARLQRIPGVRIPSTVVLDARALQSFVQHSFSEREWQTLVDDYRAGRRAPLFAELAHAPLPPRLLTQLLDAAPPEPLLMVRSSGLAEDSATASLAGHFESVVARREAGSLAVALKKCWLVGLRVLLDELAAHHDLLTSMALVIQPVVAAERSGVYFTQSPVQAGRGMLVSNWGTCHAVVAGTVATDQWILKGGTVAEEFPRFKFEMSIVDATARMPGETLGTPCGLSAVHQVLGDHVYLARVPPGLDGQPSLGPAHRAALIDAGRRLEAALGHPVDMEWSFADGDLVVLQARPITTRPPRRRAPRADAVYRVASAGVARGPVRLITSPAQLDRVSRGDILAVVATDPDYMPMLYRAGGLLSEEGSPLSHTAIVARELKIPCLLGVPLNTMREGELVTIDAHHGVLSREPLAPTPAPTAQARSDLFFMVSHLDQARGRSEVSLTQSALLLGCESSSLDLMAYLQALHQRYEIGHIRVVPDLH